MNSKNILKSFGFVVLGIILQFSFIQSVAALEEVRFDRMIKNELIQPVDLAVADNGEIFVLDKKLSKVFIYKEDGKLLRSFGEKGTLPGQFQNPHGLALTLKGEIVVADTGNHRIQVFLPNGYFSYELGNVGTNAGEFKSPVSVAVDPLGNIFVADAILNRLTKFSPSGVFLNQLDLAKTPADMSFDAQGRLYVLLSHEKLIEVYNDDFKKINETTLLGNGFDPDLSAECLIVDFRGDVYLVDHTHHKIIKMDEQKNILISFGSKGKGKGQFDNPQGIVSDKKGNIFVADLNNRRVQKMFVSGSQKETLEKAEYIPAQLDYEKSIYVGAAVTDINYREKLGLYALNEYTGQIIVKDEDKQSIFYQEDKQLQYKNPRALYVLKNGKILVADSGHNRLQFLNADGTYNYQFGQKGDKTSEFHGLGGVAVDKRGYIYVSDTNNHRIQVFNEDGIYLSTFGSRSEPNSEGISGEGAFLYPKDLAFNSQDKLYVLDYSNKRIQIFTRDGEYISQIPREADKGLLNDPVDFSIDENDYIFVADRGDHAVKILDPNGKMITQFGSKAIGRSYFPKLSSIASSNGKIYVSDYLVDKVQVFRYNNNEKLKEGYFLLTKVSKPLNMLNSSENIRLAMSRKLLLADLKNEFIEKIGVLEEDLQNVFKVEEEIVLGNGQLQMTISVPKSIIPNKYTIIGMK